MDCQRPSPGLPHARGGVSPSAWSSSPVKKSSPRPWGCFFHVGDPDNESFVFPTPVGVFLNVARVCYVITGLPHARGGVSVLATNILHPFLSSPRPWGCFWARNHQARFHLVFPTPVGVFPFVSPINRTEYCLPHARGGVSYFGSNLYIKEESSPRPWGCFYGWLGQFPRLRVFPTPVGVFPSRGSPACAA